MKGVVLTFCCSTMSYPTGGRIASGEGHRLTPEEARGRLDEFYRVAKTLIKNAERQARARKG